LGCILRLEDKYSSKVLKYGGKYEKPGLLSR